MLAVVSLCIYLKGNMNAVNFEGIDAFELLRSMLTLSMRIIYTVHFISRYWKLYLMYLSLKNGSNMSAIHI